MYIIFIYIYIPIHSLQVVNSSSPMPVQRTVASSSVMTASAACAATRGRRLCRSRAPATSCTGRTPRGWPSPRWRRHCWALRRGRWRLRSTARTVGHFTHFLIFIHHTAMRFVPEGLFFAFVCLFVLKCHTAIGFFGGSFFTCGQRLEVDFKSSFGMWGGSWATGEL